MLLFWVAVFTGSLVIPWSITSYFAKFHRHSTMPEFRAALNQKMMQLLGILVIIIWTAVFAGILVGRFIIAR